MAVDININIHVNVEGKFHGVCISQDSLEQWCVCVCVCAVSITHTHKHTYTHIYLFLCDLLQWLIGFGPVSPKILVYQ